METLGGEALESLLRSFLSEDIGRSDVTTEATVHRGTRAEGELVAKSECVVSGLPVARRVLELLDGDLAWSHEAPAGSPVSPPAVLARLGGHARAILAGERVALNLLQRMCGIATATRRLVDAVAGTGCQILDTRKTAPGLRPFDRQAVRDGGGRNHRYDLTEMVLIKDNHRRLAGGVAKAVASARASAPSGTPIEVEIESEKDLAEALSAGADRILIDNQRPETAARWCKLARDTSSRTGRPIFIEASGGISLETVRGYALAGVDAVSVGSLTHSVAAADISLELSRG